MSLSGVHGGMADPRWVDDILPLLTDDGPLGVDSFHTHSVPLKRDPQMYETFQKKQDGCVKVLLKPGA